MADKKLRRVRKISVGRVSKPVIKQLVDDLLHDEIINDGEKDSILEENDTKGDKARDLIDTVKKKGDTASQKMIAHLKRRDKNLHSKLGLKKGDEASRKMINHHQKRDPELSSELGLQNELTANRLEVVRRSFVENVSKAVISQLLDDLFEDGVLNRGEMDSITEEIRGRANKARKLIDDVFRKGDDASRKMIHHLQRRDPELSSKLGLRGELTVAQPQQEQQRSNQLKKGDGAHKKMIHHHHQKRDPELSSELGLQDELTAYTLKHIKSSFVEKVSQEVIGQLLDDLHGDGVLNHQEKLSFQMNMVADVRAGELIDTVVKKGDEASRKLIHHLQKRDPELHSKLGLQVELAANKLHRIKSSFVENVSQDVIKQLLDDLHGDGVLNRREKLSFQMNMVGAVRAGELIDTVLKKEDEASRKLIHHLQKRDPELHSKLGL